MIANSLFEKKKFLFVGTEVEGPLSGSKTLFVSDDVPLQNIMPIFEQTPDISHIYFGANHLSRINLHSVLRVFEQTGHHITLEISDWVEFISMINEMESTMYNEAIVNCLNSSRVFLMCCIYKGPQNTTFANNVQLLDLPHTNFKLNSKSLNTLLVKIESVDGVFVSTLKHFTHCSWDDYSGDVTVWEETVNVT